MMQMIETRLSASPVAAAATNALGNVSDLVALIKVLQPATPPAPVSTPAAELFQAFKSGIEVMREAGSGDSGGKGVMDVIDSLLHSPMLAAVAAAITQQTRTAPPAPQQPSRPAISAAQPLASSNETVPQTASKAKIPTQEVFRMIAANPALQAQAKQSIDYLTQLAGKNADPEFYAEWVCDNWNRNFIELLVDREDWFSLVCGVTPEATGYEAWFTKLVVEIREILEDADATGDANGDARGSSAHNLNGNSRRSSGDAGDFEANGDVDEAGQD
jgi:hypothetical protein